jgi:hypothetical protein
MKTKILFFDIETNAIDHWPTLGGLTDLHCISVFNPEDIYPLRANERNSYE